MKRNECLLTGGHTAYLLACALGPGQNWEGVLNDFRQGRRDFGCRPLMPVARVRRGTRKAIPVYRPADFRRFVLEVRAARGCKTPFPFTPKRYIVEDDEPGAYWITRTATPVP